MKLAAEDGYLLLTTLFFLIVSVIFTTSMIRISSSHILQYNQLSHTYQAKAAINISKSRLLKEIDKNVYPQTGVIKTSNGEVFITNRQTEDVIHYHFELAYKNGVTYRDDLIVQKSSILIEEPSAVEN